MPLSDFVLDRPPHGTSARRSPGARSVALAILLLGALTVDGCTSDRVTSPRSLADQTAVARSVAAATLPALIEEPIQLTTPTYDGTGEAVHPDVIEFPFEWNGWRYWMTMTPYARSDSKIENPSILVSHDGVHFEIPNGLTNPVVAHHGRPGDYNSDPELVYNEETTRLLLFYRFVDRRANSIYVVSTRNGITWAREPKAFWARTHNAVSPTVSPREGDVSARMWYVEAGKDGCKTSASRVVTRYSLDPSPKIAGIRWSEPTPTDLAQPGYVIWHIKARYVPSKREYWALYAAFPNGPAGCDIDDLFFARSTDGVHWETFAEPILRHEDRAWTAAAIYRSTFLYDSTTDQLRVWLSARGADNKWRLGFAHFRYDRLLADLTNAGARPARSSASRIPIGHSETDGTF
jgi:hypothetical protein